MTKKQDRRKTRPAKRSRHSGRQRKVKVETVERYPWKAKTCEVCGKQFIKYNNRVTCSDSCSNELKRRRDTAWHQEHAAYCAKKSAEYRVLHPEASTAYNAARRLAYRAAHPKKNKKD